MRTLNHWLYAVIYLSSLKVKKLLFDGMLLFPSATVL